VTGGAEKCQLIKLLTLVTGGIDYYQLHTAIIGVTSVATVDSHCHCPLESGLPFLLLIPVCALYQSLLEG